MKKSKRNKNEHDGVEEASTFVEEEELEPQDSVEEEPEADASDDDSQNELEAIMLQRDEFKAALQRERADFVNFKKRTEREKADMKRSLTGDAVAKFLPILDDFERALHSVPSETEENGWLTGFTMIHKKFNDVLGQMGIEVINPVGEPFDPNVHEAIGSEASDEYESGTVTEVLQKGYRMDGRVLRVAMVKVAE